MSPTSFSSRKSDFAWSCQQFDPCSPSRSTRTAIYLQGTIQEGSTPNPNSDPSQGAVSPQRTRFCTRHRRRPGTNPSTTTTRLKDTIHTHLHFNSFSNKTTGIIHNNPQHTLVPASAAATHGHRQESLFHSDDDPATETIEALVEGSIQNRIRLPWMAWGSEPASTP